MSTAELNPQAPSVKPGLPRQVPYIIGNEACERFSFYGMRNILTPFLVTSLLLYAPEAERAGIAKDVLPLLRDRRVLLPAPRRLDRRSAPRQVPHDPLAVAGLLRGARVPRRVRRQPHRLLHRAVPDRAGFGRHQTTRRVVRRRSVRPDEQTHREDRVRCVLLDHQLRLVLRLAAHAHLPAQLRAGSRLRYPRNTDVHRHRHLLGGTQEVRERSARPCRPAFVPARRVYSALGAQRRTGTPRAHHRRHRRGAGDRCVRDDRIAGLRRLRMPGARLPAGVRWHRRVPATRSRERGTSARIESKACVRCCASSSSSRW